MRSYKTAYLPLTSQRIKICASCLLPCFFSPRSCMRPHRTREPWPNRKFHPPARFLRPNSHLTSADHADIELDGSNISLSGDRKSTRLNSSHLGISYAV